MRVSRVLTVPGPAALAAALLAAALLLPSVGQASQRKPAWSLNVHAELGVKHAEFTGTTYYTDGTSRTSSEDWRAGFDAGLNVQLEGYFFEYTSGESSRLNVGGLLDVTVGGWQGGFMGQVHGGLDMLLAIFRFQMLGGVALYPGVLEDDEGGLLNLSGASIGFVGGLAIPLKKFDRGQLELDLTAGVQVTVGPARGFRAPVRLGLSWLTYGRR